MDVSKRKARKGPYTTSANLTTSLTPIIETIKLMPHSRGILRVYKDISVRSRNTVQYFATTRREPSSFCHCGPLYFTPLSFQVSSSEIHGLVRGRPRPCTNIIFAGPNDDRFCLPCFCMFSTQMYGRIPWYCNSMVLIASSLGGPSYGKSPPSVSA